MIKKLLLPSIFVMCFQFTAHAQFSPGCVNNPGLLPVGTDCSSPSAMDSTNNSKVWGTNSTGCGASNLDDVWSAFVAVSTSTTITYTPINAAFNPILHIFDGNGNCGPVTGGTTYLACSNTGGAGVAETIVLTTVIGDRYRIRVQDATTNNNYTGTICVYDSTSTGPPNDLCTNATALPCGTTTLAGSSNGASNLAHGTGCSTSNYGVWYTFVGDGNQTTISAAAAAGYDHRLNIARGGCGGFTSVACIDGAGGGGTETYTFITTNATVYYVYIAHFSSSSTTTGNFTISRTCTPVTSPPNDAICSATPAPVNANLLCGSVVPGTLEFATNQPAIPNTCTGNPNNDVWYSFTATATSHRISLLNITGSTLDLVHQVWSGACGSPTVVAGSCSDPETSTVTGLTIGNVYFVQVYSWSSAAANTTFNLCIGTQPPCPTPVRSTGPITFGTITNVSINGSFPAAVPTPDNYIVIRSNLTAVPPTLTNGATYTIGQTFGNYTVVDTDTNTNFTATGLTQTTTYNFFIFSMNNLNCTGGPIYSTNSLNGSATTVVPTYCIPSSTNPAYYIDSFSTSGGVTNIAHVNSGFSPGGYGDFTSRTVTQYPGQVINYNITYGSSSTFTFASKVWVDWNNDLDFNDPGEEVRYVGYSNNTNSNFTVLATALPGNYRMRVRADYITTTTLSPCGFDDQSETHDYTLVVTPLNCTANPLSLVASATSTTTATISWTAPSPAPVNGYEYIVSPDNSTSTPAGDQTGFTSATSVNITGLALGTTYYVFVRGLCTAPDKGVWIPTTFTTGCTAIVTTPTVCPIIVDVQANNPYTASPFVANPAATIGCNTPTVNLVAHANLRETTSYIVEQTTYPSPAPLYDFPALGGGQAITSDDVWADTRANIGFNFCFYNQTYTQALVGANGAITFDPSIAPGSGSGYAFSSNLPSLAGALFEFTIYGVYHDLNPFGLTGTPIKSRVVGVAGCRQFQVAWNNIPMFGDSTRLFTGMIVLHESTNIIEVFIKEKRIENGNVNPWNGGNAIVGIQGDITPLAPNNQFSVAPCRNSLDTNWETTNEAWRFTPNGAVIVPSSVTWYQGSVAPGNIVPSNPDNSYTAVTGNTYIAQAVYNNLCGVSTTFTDQIVVTDGRKIWNGSVSTNWATAANWTPAVIPTPLDCVTIPVTGNNPVINGTTNGDGFSLSIFAGASLTMQSNATLTIVDQVTVAATAAFTLQSSASLIQVNNVANIGNITMLRDTNVRRQDYVYWSAPVAGFPLANVVPTSPASLRLTWNPTFDRGPGPGSFNLDYGIWETAAGNMVIGKGYATRGPSAYDNATAAIYTATFGGVPNNGTYNVPINRGTYASNATYIDQGGQVTKDDDNWNFVGNPYPSAINAKTFLTLNTSIAGTVYLWTHGTRIQPGGGSPFYGTYVYNYNQADYLEYNLSGPSQQSGFNGYIASGQGFYVLMNECPSPVSGLCPTASSTVTFNNSMRSLVAGYNNNQFFRTTEDEEVQRDRMWIDLVSPSGGTSSTLVAYVQGATDDIDRLYDARTIGGGGKDLYSVLGDDNFIIQGRQHPLDVNDQVPLGITTEEVGIFNIAIHGVDGLFETTDQDIYLEDRELNVIHDLRNAPYTFTLSESGNYDDRFILRYNTQTLGINDNNVGNFDIIAYDNQVKVTSGISPIQTVVVYDILGRVLADYKDVNLFNFDFYLVNQSKGALIVKATLTNGQQKIKKVIY